MKKFFYVPTITSKKDILTPVKGITSSLISFNVEIFECTKKGNEHIGNASIVIGGPESLVLYRRIVTKYENTSTIDGSTFKNITREELEAEHDEIIEECKRLRDVWGW